MMAALARCFTLGAMAAEQATKRGKKPHGRPPNVPTATIDEITQAALVSQNREDLSKATGISDHDARVVKRITGLTAEQYQERVTEKMRALVDESLDLLRPKLEAMSGAQLAVALGILSDKLKDSPRVAQTLHIHLASGDRSGLLGALLGKHGERVIARENHSHKEREPVSTGPIIDAELSDPGPILQSGDS